MLSIILLMEVSFPLTTACSSSTMKNLRSKFCKIPKIQTIVELTLTLCLWSPSFLFYSWSSWAPEGSGTEWVMLSAVVQGKLNSERSAEVLCNPEGFWHEFQILSSILAPFLVSICPRIHRSWGRETRENCQGLRILKTVAISCCHDNPLRKVPRCQT